jgi:hypothetical protein
MNDIGEPRVKLLSASPEIKPAARWLDPPDTFGMRAWRAPRGRNRWRIFVVLLLTNGGFIGGKDSVRLFLKPFERASP